jgi:hypothetical protein
MAQITGSGVNVLDGTAGNGSYSTSSAGHRWLVANVPLPDGATVTSLTLHAWDEHDTKEVRVNFASGDLHGYNLHNHGHFSTAGSSTGYYTASHATATRVDTDSRSYVVYAKAVESDTGDEASWPSDGSLGVRSMVIEYVLP